MVFNKALVSTIIGAFKVNAGAFMARLSGKASGVEEGIIFCIDNEGRYFNFRNAEFAAAFEIVVGGVAKSTHGRGDQIVKIDEILDLIKIDAGEESRVQFGFLNHLCLQRFQETIEVESIDPMGEVARTGIEVAGDGKDGGSIQFFWELSFMVAQIFEGDVAS